MSSVVKPLWKLLLQNPSELDCDECFAVLEYYFELLALGGPDLLPAVAKNLQGCPDCWIEHQEALCRLETEQEKRKGASR